MIQERRCENPSVLCEMPCQKRNEECQVHSHEERSAGNPGCVPCVRDQDVQDRKKLNLILGTSGLPAFPSSMCCISTPRKRRGLWFCALPKSGKHSPNSHCAQAEPSPLVQGRERKQREELPHMHKEGLSWQNLYRLPNELVYRLPR